MAGKASRRLQAGVRVLGRRSDQRPDLRAPPGDCGEDPRLRMTLAGFPATTAIGGTSDVTTAPAPMTAPSPTRTPGKMMARAPIQTSFPMTGGRDDDSPWDPMVRSGSSN